MIKIYYCNNSTSLRLLQINVSCIHVCRQTHHFPFGFAARPTHWKWNHSIGHWKDRLRNVTQYNTYRYEKFLTKYLQHHLCLLHMTHMQNRPSRLRHLHQRCHSRSSHQTTPKEVKREIIISQNSLPELLRKKAEPVSKPSACTCTHYQN